MSPEAMNPNRVRFTVYLPDGLGQRAKDAGLNLSRLLRDAVERELRGEAPAPTVQVERVGTSIELRVSLPADDLREQIAPED
jgi:hypothetical protein